MLKSTKVRDGTVGVRVCISSPTPTLFQGWLYTYCYVLTYLAVNDRRRLHTQVFKGTIAIGGQLVCWDMGTI